MTQAKLPNLLRLNHDVQIVVRPARHNATKGPCRGCVCLSKNVKVCQLEKQGLLPDLGVAAMNTPTQLDPLVSEFDTEEQAQQYDQWFREKVQQAMDDDHGFLPHDAAMAQVDALLMQKRAQRAAG